MKKKLSIFALIGFLIFNSLGTTSYANNINKMVDCSDQTICNQELESLGIPTELIAEMEIDKKEAILNSNIISFDSATTLNYEDGKLVSTTTFDKDGNSETSIEPEADLRDIELFGTIPEEKFSLTIEIYTEASSDTRKRRQLFINYNWKKTPFNNKNDPFGIAWSNNWRAVDGTTYNVDYYQTNGTWKIHDETSAIAYSNSNGVGWHADLKGGELFFKGYGKVTIETTAKNNPTGSDQLHANYAHVTGIIGTIGLNFFGVGVTIVGTKSHDERGTYRTFNY